MKSSLYEMTVHWFVFCHQKSLCSLLLTPFVVVFSTLSIPSCEVVYYMMPIVVGVVVLAVYVYVARKYKLRERDAPFHAHHSFLWNILQDTSRRKQ